MFYAFGVNKYNLNNCASEKNKDCIHAEVDCVNNLKKMEKQCLINMIIFRTNNKGDKMMMAKPCQDCLNTINIVLKKKNYLLKKLCYTDEDGSICKICL